jgi:hypothetical protein
MTDVDRYSVDAARAAAERGELGDWVVEFLASPGSDNGELAAALAARPRWWLGPLEVPLEDLNRLAGPPGEPVLVPVDEDYWRDDVDDLGHKVRRGYEPPPVIATYRDGELFLEDGNHRVEGVRRSGATATWAVIGFDDPAERDRVAGRLGGRRQPTERGDEMRDEMRDRSGEEMRLAERYELRRRQRDEAADAWPGLGSVTDAQMKGSLVGIVVGAVVGAVVFLPLALIPWGGLAVGWRLLLAAVCGAVAGAVALAVYLGGREPEREGEAIDTEGTHEVR